MSAALTLPISPGFRLDGRHALVTGAGRGLGLAAATALAEAGAAVTLAARTLAEIEDAARALRDRGLKASAHAVDVTDTQAIAALMVGADAPFDILVNNAGTNKPGPFVEVTEANYDLVMGLNVRSAFFTSQAFARRLIVENRPGVIINMTSQMGHVGAARRTIYCASKHALEGLTKALAVELAEHGIRVNSVAPTFIETPMTKPFFEDEEFRRQTLSKIKLGRIGRVEDIMGAIVYLASDAAALVTGTSLLVDGGWTAE
ncbi:glucose 1-dehydrogenase [Agrobacterium vitis]|uniref:Glucose 1-dehydrogenase n=1 Tax=Agrobacterium vitis TaxID=373 RepID=A0AAE4X077_AGRVI|nr:glucose 1-dehydrogenase [Agrobacterium vitis]MBF2714144.1 glucose 1-dehydrogenase [Agrobacterium vitis]MUO81523.1 glucose 1-dehydrogenase [Agrobacterium vitis]MUO95830.1 glucose 1-dehydrogenase [Agrobacterium vitis]MVA93909.1 glucose 1-dehydrogenase [Agrobacterium vitis]MVB03584.1 glucose 1-dehydrogenase [Agrobacterium vitis]